MLCTRNIHGAASPDPSGAHFSFVIAVARGYVGPRLAIHSLRFNRHLYSARRPEGTHQTAKSPSIPARTAELRALRHLQPRQYSRALRVVFLSALDCP